MKLDLDTGTVIEGNVDTSNEVKMLIAEEAMPHIAQLLTNLYNDPLSAVFREYVANGVDAHKEAGIDEPVEVWIPNSSTPMFRVVDKGVGMSTSLMREIYSQYGLSTKQKTNFTIGGFGLGCKSALAITSQFTVTSVKDGVQTTAIIHNSEDGVSRLNVADVRDTDKHNGTVVSIPVTQHHDFSSRAYNFMDYFPEGSILINGDKANTNFKTSKADRFLMEITPVDGTTAYLYRSKGYSTRSSVRFIMGGVLYNIPDEDIQNVVREGRGGTVSSDMYDLLSAKELIIEAPVGAAKLSPSREGVQFNDRTKDYFREVYKALEEKYKKTLEDSLFGMQTYKDAVDFWLGLEFRDRSLMGDIKYEGIKLSGFLCVSEKGFYVSHVKYENRNSFDDLSEITVATASLPAGRIFSGNLTVTSAKRLLGDYLKSQISKGGEITRLLYIPEGAKFNHDGRTRKAGKDDDGNPIVETVFEPLSKEDLKVILGSETLETTDIETVRDEVKAYRKEVRDSLGPKAPAEKKPETKYVTFESDGLFYYRTGSEIADIEDAELAHIEVRRKEFSSDPLQVALDVHDGSASKEPNTILADIYKNALGDSFVLVCMTGARTTKALDKAIGVSVPSVSSAVVYKNSLSIVSEITQDEIDRASLMHYNSLLRNNSLNLLDPFFDTFTMELYNKVNKAVQLLGLATRTDVDALGTCPLTAYRGFTPEYRANRAEKGKYLHSTYPLVESINTYTRAEKSVQTELEIYMNAKYQQILANNDDA